MIGQKLKEQYAKELKLARSEKEWRQKRREESIQRFNRIIGAKNSNECKNQP